jgi:hypothetical protein
LKRMGKKLTSEQEDFQTWCIGNNVPHSVCRTLDEVLYLFENWNCLRVKLTQRATT